MVVRQPGRSNGTMMPLEQNQLEELSVLCGLKVGHPSPAFSVSGPEMLDKKICREVLDDIGPLLGSRSRKIIASLLSKRIAFLTTAAALYPMSAYNRGLDLSLENCVIDYSHDTKRWQSAMYLNSLAPTVSPSDARHIWRKDICQKLFSDNLARLWQSLHEASSVTLSILWENTAVRVYSLYERRLRERLVTEQCVLDDFNYLTKEAEGCLFGEKDNPIERFYFDKTPAGQKEIRFRRTCCYYYLTPQKKYCSTCPLLLNPRVKSDA